MVAHAFNSKRCVYLCEFQASRGCVLRLQRKEGREEQRREGQKERGRERRKEGGMDGGKEGGREERK